MKWTQEVTSKFIDLYREEEILWDSKNPHYYNRIKKHDAWEKIQMNFELPLMSAKRKVLIC
nr:unnamed protein product [Callosobruchus analis]